MQTEYKEKTNDYINKFNVLTFIQREIILIISFSI